MCSHYLSLNVSRQSQKIKHSTCLNTDSKWSSWNYTFALLQQHCKLWNSFYYWNTESTIWHFWNKESIHGTSSLTTRDIWGKYRSSIVLQSDNVTSHTANQHTVLIVIWVTVIYHHTQINRLGIRWSPPHDIWQVKLIITATQLSRMIREWLPFSPNKVTCQQRTSHTFLRFFHIQSNIPWPTLSHISVLKTHNKLQHQHKFSTCRFYHLKRFGTWILSFFSLTHFTYYLKLDKMSSIRSICLKFSTQRCAIP